MYRKQSTALVLGVLLFAFGCGEGTTSSPTENSATDGAATQDSTGTSGHSPEPNDRQASAHSNGTANTVPHDIDDGATADSFQAASFDYLLASSPYLSGPGFFDSASRLEKAFRRSIEIHTRLSTEPLPSPDEQGDLREKLASVNAEWDSARDDLLAYIQRSEQDAEIDARAVAQDILVLAWRLGEQDRIALLRDTIEVSPTVEEAVKEAIMRCVIQEMAYQPMVPETNVEAEVTTEEESDTGEEVTLIPVLRGQLSTGSQRVANFVWTPSPAFGAYDARELVQAWLHSNSSNTTFRQRYEYLCQLLIVCAIPEWVPDDCMIARTADGEPVMVSTTALRPIIEPVAIQQGAEGGETGTLMYGSYNLATAVFNNRRNIKKNERRIEELEAITANHADQLEFLHEAVKAVNYRVDEANRRIDDAFQAIEELEQRVSTIENFLSGQLSIEQQNQLLRQVAPVLRHHEWASGPMLRPSVYAEGCTLMPVSGASDALIQELRDRGGRPWTAVELAAWIQTPSSTEGPRWGQLCNRLEMIPHRMRRLGLGTDAGLRIGGADRAALNRQAIDNGWAVFGVVQDLGAADGVGEWSVKYFWFNGWNETAFPFGEGNHEGDWGCVDLTVRVQFVANNDPETRDATPIVLDIASAQVIDAIFHEHGRPRRVSRRQMDPQSGRVSVYLERGTNEAHYAPGGDTDFQGIPDGGLLPGWITDNTTKWPVIRAHQGGGYQYDLSIHGVINLMDDDQVANNIDAQLVRYFAGQWGEYDDDDLKWLHDRDATNPHGPLDQGKFVNRQDVLDERDH